MKRVLSPELITPLRSTGASVLACLAVALCAQATEPPRLSPQESAALLEGITVQAQSTLLPAPRLFPQTEGCVQPSYSERMGSTPRPTKEQQEELGQFIEGRVDATQTLDLIVGRQTILRLKEAPKRVQTPGDEILAEPVLVNPKELALTGKKVGSTVLRLYFTDPKDATKERIITYLVRVLLDPEIYERREKGYKILQDQINQVFPDSVVHLTLVQNKLIVSGQAKDAAEAAQILRMVGVTTAEPVRVPVSQVNLNVNVASGPDGLPPGGLPEYLVQAEDGQRFAVINLLRVPGEQQVLLRVTVAEINRTAARSIGVNFSIFNNKGQQVFANLTGSIAGQTAGTGGGGNGSGSGLGTIVSSANNLPTVLDNGKIIAAVDALRNLNFARSLAEPTLTTLAGQTASFQAGGTFPVPVVTGATAIGLQGVQFIPFGVQLSFTPYITDKDRIRLIVAAEVSTRDPSLGSAINGASVPGTSTRNFQSTVEMREGQTLAVAGLIQNNYGANATRVPFFGDLPVIGRLFAFDQTSSGEQEVLILITPELVHPLEQAACPPLPGGDVFEPGDVEFYLLGRLESRRPYDYRTAVRTDIGRMARYRHCEELFIFGPSGHSDGKK
jgi:pilus assembly protein CpaC